MARLSHGSIAATRPCSSSRLLPEHPAADAPQSAGALITSAALDAAEDGQQLQGQDVGDRTVTNQRISEVEEPPDLTERDLGAALLLDLRQPLLGDVLERGGGRERGYQLVPLLARERVLACGERASCLVPCRSGIGEADLRVYAQGQRLVAPPRRQFSPQ